MTLKAQNMEEVDKKYRYFRMYLNLKDYPYKMSRQSNIYKPHSNQKSKTYNKYTHIQKKQKKKENHQNSKKDIFLKNEQRATKITGKQVRKWHQVHTYQGFPVGSVIKDLPGNAGDTHLIPESGRFPAEGNGNPLQYSCLRNPMHRGAYGIIVPGVAKESDMT